jgi:hypothetical protein
MMNEHERADRERDAAAEYAIEAFLEGASENELRRFRRSMDRGPFGGSPGMGAASEVPA